MVFIRAPQKRKVVVTANKSHITRARAYEPMVKAKINVKIVVEIKEIKIHFLVENLSAMIPPRNIKEYVADSIGRTEML
jgi:hypothetical protein